MAPDLSEAITGLYTMMGAKLMQAMAPREIYGMSALLPLPKEKGSTVSPTSEQLTTLTNCSADWRAALGEAWCDVVLRKKYPATTPVSVRLRGDASSAGQLAAYMQRCSYHVEIEEVVSIHLGLK
jgi:hypothetical protein